MNNLTNPKWIKAKGLLFLLLGLLSTSLLTVQYPHASVLLLVMIAVWSFCRFYFFMFYVIEHYVDDSYRFSGLISFVHYFFRKELRNSGAELPSFHDGSFEGVWTSIDRRVHIYLRTADNRPFTMVLGDVKGMRLSNVRQGNMILDLVLIPTEQLTEEHIESVHEVSDVNRQEQISKLLASARQERLKMLELSASYGAEGNVLCQSIQLLERKTTNIPVRLDHQETWNPGT